MKNVIISLGLLAGSAAAVAQNVSVYGNSNATVGIDYNISQRFSAGIRYTHHIGNNAYPTDYPFPVLSANIIKSEKVDLNLGFGSSVFEGKVLDHFSVPIGLRAYPFAERKLAFTVEAECVNGDSDFNVFPSIGILYKLGK